MPFTCFAPWNGQSIFCGDDNGCIIIYHGGIYETIFTHTASIVKICTDVAHDLIYFEDQKHDIYKAIVVSDSFTLKCYNQICNGFSLSGIETCGAYIYKVNGVSHTYLEFVGYNNGDLHRNQGVIGNVRAVDDKHSVDAITCMHLSRDKTRLLTGGTYGHICIWNVKKPYSLIKKIQIQNATFNNVRYSRNEKFIIASCDKPRLYIWDASTYSLLHIFDTPMYVLWCEMFSDDKITYFNAQGHRFIMIKPLESSRFMFTGRCISFDDTESQTRIVLPLSQVCYTSHKDLQMCIAVMNGEYFYFDFSTKELLTTEFNRLQKFMVDNV